MDINTRVSMGWKLPCYVFHVIDWWRIHGSSSLGLIDHGPRNSLKVRSGTRDDYGNECCNSRWTGFMRHVNSSLVLRLLSLFRRSSTFDNLSRSSSNKRSCEEDSSFIPQTKEIGFSFIWLLFSVSLVV